MSEKGKNIAATVRHRLANVAERAGTILELLIGNCTENTAVVKDTEGRFSLCRSEVSF